jgi:hypothetical protein
MRFSPCLGCRQPGTCKLMSRCLGSPEARRREIKAVPDPDPVSAVSVAADLVRRGAMYERKFHALEEQIRALTARLDEHERRAAAARRA